MIREDEIHTDRTLLIIDGNSMVFRSFFGIPPTMLSHDGIPTNAAYGFVSTLTSVLKHIGLDAIICAFDGGTPRYRQEISEGTYKANRPSLPNGLSEQFKVIEKILDSMNIPWIRIAGWEGDDIIGTLARHVQKSQRYQTFILSSDQDLFQLVDKTTYVMAPQKANIEPKLYGIKEVIEKTGVSPIQIPDYKGMKGDPSDNIKGVAGIGEKGAADLLQKYANLEDIYAHIENIKPAIAKKLLAGKEDAYNSRTLATISTTVDLLADTRWKKLCNKYKTDEIIKIIDTVVFPNYNEREFLSCMERYDFGEHLINAFLKSSQQTADEIEASNTTHTKDNGKIQDEEEKVEFNGTLFG